MSETEAAEPEPTTADESAKTKDASQPEPLLRWYFGSFTQSDKRMFAITFGGTLVANLVTGLFVAAGIVVYRFEYSPVHYDQIGSIIYVITFPVIGTIVLGFVTLLVIARWRRRWFTAVMRPVWLVSVLFMILIFGLGLLTLLGRAASMK
jgi:hypothetical protein